MEENAQSLFESEEPSELQKLKQKRRKVQAQIQDVLETLNLLNEQHRRLNAEIEIFEKQIKMF